VSIQVLAPEIADAIAAGEVVERPAAALKELLENSLDAGARRVVIEVRGAGKTLIRVADDGSGIPPEELELAFRRHATSKIRRLEDLERVSSLGFRGEALASIASVAEVECRSGPARIRLRHGRVLEQGVAPPSPGTVIEIRDLFQNTPARLRFLKTDATEIAACRRQVEAYALIYPGVRFELLVDGRPALRSSGSGEARDAALAVHGERIAVELMPVESHGVRGLISGPSLSRGNRDGILLAVNRRPIFSRSLLHAIEECYAGLLERGRYPVVVLNLELDGSLVDVNVHPTKREVRFHHESGIFASLQRAIRATLEGSQVPNLVLAERDTSVAAPMTAAGTVSGSWGAKSTARAALAPAGLPGADPDEPPAARAVGQVGPGYLVAEAADGLILIDQHAAHERVLYNRLLARLRAGGVASQPLLLAEVVELDAGMRAAADDNFRQLRDLGFEFEDFGPQALRLTSAPADTPAARAPDALRELLQVLAGSGTAGERLEGAAASLACHSAVRFGDQLDPAEQARLLRELDLTEPSLTCPHGRPTRLLVSWAELRRHFRRNY